MSEPVAWYWDGDEPRVSLEKPLNSWRSEWKPLYLSPPTDGLRKAAIDAQELLFWWRGYAPPILQPEEQRIIDNLSDALKQ